MELSTAIPIFKISSEKLAREYYLDRLGFSMDWEHRRNDYPAYLQVSKGDLIIHLTEHEGDAEPGTTILVSVSDIESLYSELRRGLPSNKFAIIKAGKNHVLEIDDPFGNHIRFVSPSR
ncbi:MULTISPECIES: glyoxalase superfamily protein [unclassified Pseudomonas]|uniref:glyoxalase superfamily protein n=1 Tax=unclassified Pseudomonas TaxID=196821 RepID=UPI000A1ECBDB|nr:MULTISPECIES: glyoxalase superfamily protein [unclassified Pseudomonas]